MKHIVIPTLAAVLLTACGSDSSDSNEPENREQPAPAVPSPDPEPAPEANKFTFALTTERDAVKPNYLITQEDIMNANSTISSQGQGIEISDFAYFYTVNNTLFSLSSTSVKAYAVQDGEVKEINEAQPGNITYATFGNANNEKLLAIDSNWSELLDHKLYTFDAATGKSEGSVDLTILSDNSKGAAWPTALVIRDNELYVPYLKLTSQAATPDADAAFVAVFDYPLTDGSQPKKTITTDTVSNIGTHGSSTGLVKAENGDLYGYTNGEISGGFNPASSKPSSIVRIKNGETEFDTDYTFNIEAATNGGKIFWMDYVGNNTVIARIVERVDTLVDHDQNSETPNIPLGDALDNVAWEDYYNTSGNAFRQKLYTINLETKELKAVEGVPAHWQRLYPNTEVMDNKYYTTIITADGAAVYEIDLTTNQAKKGSSIEGFTLRGLQNLYN
ncbi:DUF4374 domain-containing protein [Bacterioplanoides sp.]|uniref:DUF4374 domain-containing protein n=1 Tax=Bacterioplanoides sp. TaxID=2066072 RepID=UPI003B0058CA